MNTAVDRIFAMRHKRSMRRHPAPTFLFADLVGYTALTEARGDEAAAELAREFRRRMRALARKYDAWQVRSMGDGVMIWSADAGKAVSLAMDAVREIGGDPELLPVRVGVDTGPAVLRGMDWFGSTVNVAARLADEAEPGQALITGSTLSAAFGPVRNPSQDQRVLRLRGVERPVIAWRLT